MTDPFSVSAGVVGVVSLGLTLSQGLLHYYTPWRDYDDEIKGFTTKVNGLLHTLHLLNDFLSLENELQLPSNQYRLLVLDNLTSCKDACQRLEKMLKECKSTKLNTSSSSSTPKRDWFRLERAAYPFKRDTLVTLSDLVSGLHDNLSLSLQLLTSACMGQQQRQIHDLILKISSIDLRTTGILTVVEQQEISTNSQAIVQHSRNTSDSTRPTPPTMPAPSILRDLCDKQQLINTWLRRKRRVPAGSQIEQIARYCTCREKPQFVPPSYELFLPRCISWSSLSAYSLHDESCQLHVDGQQALGLAGSYTFCNRFLGLSLQVMISITRGAGPFAISPEIRAQAIVSSDSPVYDIQTAVCCLNSYSGVIRDGDLFEIKTNIFQMFREGKASPTDRLEDGSTILHALFSSSFVTSLRGESKSRCDLMDLVKSLIDAGVPTNERTLHL